MAINKKLIHFNTFENFNSKKLSANAENTLYTIGINGSVQTGSPDILYQSIVYIKDTKQQWTHGLLYNCSDSESLLKTYTFLENSNFLTITQEEFEKIQNADIVYFYDEPNNIQLTVKNDNNGNIGFLGYYLSSYPDNVKIYSIMISQALLVVVTLDSISLSDYISDYINELSQSYIAAVYDEFVDGAYVQIVENLDLLLGMKPTILLLMNYNQDYTVSLLGPYILGQADESPWKFIGEHNDLSVECVFNIQEGEIVGTLHIKSKSEGGGTGNSDANVQAVDEISTIIDVDLDKYIVETTDDNIILDNNKYYKKTNVSSSISITLNIPEDNTVFTSFSIEFTTSESGTSVSLPDTIKWLGGELPTFENNFTYQISICNGLGVCAKYA